MQSPTTQVPCADLGKYNSLANQEIYKWIRFVHLVHVIISDLKEGLGGMAGRKARTLNPTEASKREYI